SVETRGGEKRPQLSDLRESGAIEQDADMVIFLYRPEYYNLDTDAQNNSVKGKTEVIIAKHRNGKLDTVNLRFIPHLMKFTDGDPSWDRNDNFGLPSGDNPRSLGTGGFTGGYTNNPNAN